MTDPNKRKPCFAYRSFWKEFDAMRNFAFIGVKQYCVFAGNTANSLGEPYAQYDPVWKWYDSYDFAPFDEQVRNLVKICPDAEILCMIDLNSPLWLARQLYVDSYPQLSNALTNARWRAETEKYVRAFVSYAEKHYGDRIKCYIAMCGVTDEWMDYAKGDETEGKLQYYREWCRKKSLPAPEDAPTVRERFAAPHLDGTLRDPTENRDAIQYWKFHSELIADSIIHFSSIIRSLVSPDKEIGVFYGYILELVAGRLVQSGHLAYEKLEASDTIDFVISPGDYSDRPMGGGSGFMTPNGTVHLHGKSCLYEIDHRTHTANMQLTPHVALKWMNEWKNTAEDVAGLRREFCRALFHGASLWWFDMWGRFYVEKEVLEAIGGMRRLWDEYADRSFEPEAEIALFVDPESTYLINDQDLPGRKISHLYQYILKALNRLGTPYRVYSMNDIPKVSELKLAVFAGAVEITPERRSMLERRLFGKTACFWYGPSGLSDGKNWRQQDLPGEKFPLFGEITPEVLKKVAERAGVHFYIDSLCPVWAGRNLISVHTAQGGEKRIRLRKKADSVIELFSGGKVAENVSEFIYDFMEPETALFKIVTGK